MKQPGRGANFSHRCGLRGGLPAVLVLAFVPVAWAHEVRPAYLELRETRAGEFEVLWKTPMRGDLRLALQPAFPEDVQVIAPVITRQARDAAIQTWKVRAGQHLRGRIIAIDGLQATMTDALARIEFADGTDWTHRLTPQRPSAVIPKNLSRLHVAGTYLALGVEHILAGIDHLLFVLGLIIITRGGWKLVKTVTAFTVSHSFTLTAATLGWVNVPSRPVEAIIALSIVFVSAEIIYGAGGRPGIASRAPWVVALTFGLLHGLGFAGGLLEAGLPARHIPTALLFFSVGVEVGHLVFVGAVVGLLAALHRVRVSLPPWTQFVPPYAIGSIAAFWLIQRVSDF